MNDKLGRIAADALDAALTERYTLLDHDQLTRFADEFAHRIIRECIDVAFHSGHPDLEFLLKHFGVEE